MDVGIGLPNTIPGTDGAALIGWAKRAEARGFSSLATIGRVIWPGYEELVALAAAAGATERIGLLSNVMIGPARNTVLLANQAASLDRLSGGRFTLGVGVGWRTDDYEAAGLDYHSRGRLLDEQLAELAAAWRGEHIGGTPKRVGPEPTRESGVPVLVGGSTDRAVRRVVRWGAGWTAGGGSADQLGPFAARVREAWAEAGRDGEPRVVALTYFALGDDAEERAAAYLSDYYGDFGNQMAAAIPKTAEALRETVERFRDAGVGELILDPAIADDHQVDGAADALFSR